MLRRNNKNKFGNRRGVAYKVQQVDRPKRYSALPSHGQIEILYHRKMRIGLVLAFSMVAILARGAQGQGPAVKAVQFKAALKTVLSDSARWQKTIDDIDIESLPVVYSTGKVYEQNKANLSLNLKAVVLWAQRVQQQDSLYGEVVFLTALLDFENQLQQFAYLILDGGLSGQTSAEKVSKWSDALTTLANTTVNDLYKTAFIYTTDHARLIDQMCSQSKSVPQRPY